MTTTTTPSTLSEYQEHVRKEALKIQLDMGWPDDKLNATLRALGLPEKVTFTVPVKVTGEMFVALQVNDTASEEEARASIAGKSPEELRRLIGMVISTGSFSQFESTVLDETLPLEVGGLDTTATNGSVARANNHGRLCEQYNSTGRNYCTLPRDHDGDQHAQGDGSVILAAWPVAA